MKKECPLCQGKGYIESKRVKYSDKQRELAHELYRKGMTLRAIGELIGIKGKNHPQKVAELIMKLNIEQQARCGDGAGRILSHSINCDCERIYKEIGILEAELAL